jgi:hypothetical protein
MTADLTQLSFMLLSNVKIVITTVITLIKVWISTASRSTLACARHKRMRNCHIPVSIIITFDPFQLIMVFKLIVH